MNDSNRQGSIGVRDTGRLSQKTTMKKWVKRIVLVLLSCVTAVALLCSWWIARYNMITGNWSDPAVRFWNVRHSSSPDKSRLLIHYYYTLTQTALLKYPHYVWKGTAWENKISSRVNTLSKGYGLAVVDGNKAKNLPLEESVKSVLWFNGTAFCKTESGWFSIVGNTLQRLPASFKEPEAITNSLSEVELMLPATADKFPEIATGIREASLSKPGRRNYYKPIEQEKRTQPSPHE